MYRSTCHQRQALDNKHRYGPSLDVFWTPCPLLVIKAFQGAPFAPVYIRLHHPRLGECLGKKSLEGIPALLTILPDLARQLSLGLSLRAEVHLPEATYGEKLVVRVSIGTVVLASLL